ncbi:MAG: cytochrome c oxidase subunit II [Chloroflexota bacterium]
MTQQGQQSASLYGPVFLIAIVIFILVEGLILLVTLRFRRKKTDADLPPQTHGNNLLEVVWTAIPFLVVMVLFVASALVVLPKVDAVAEDPAVTVDVTAFQWQWTFEYQDSGLAFTGSGKQGPEMVLPVNEPVTIRLHAQDVIHSFYVPAFFYKKDAIPGRTNEFSVTVEKPGTYGGQCAEFCGLAHADMYFTIRAVERGEYDAWLQQAIADANATPTPEPSVAPGASAPAAADAVVEVTTPAENPLGFSESTITAKAGTTLQVDYTNESGVPHNMAFYESKDASGPVIAVTEDPSKAKPGPGAKQSVTFEVPDKPGTYFFDCQIHPQQMFGTFEVTA